MPATDLWNKTWSITTEDFLEKNFVFFYSAFPNGYISKLSAPSSAQFETYSNFARMFSHMSTGSIN